MGRYSALFTWFIVTLLTATGAYWAFESGLLEIVYRADITHFSQVIAALLFLGNLRVGYLAWQFGAHQTGKLIVDRGEGPIKKLRKHLDEWWFVATLFMYIGIAGTSIGAFYLAYNGFGAITGSVTPEQAGQLLGKVFPALGTVFSVTGAGVIATIIMMVQLFLFTSITGIEDHRYDE